MACLLCGRVTKWNWVTADPTSKVTRSNLPLDQTMALVAMTWELADILCRLALWIGRYIFFSFSISLWMWPDSFSLPESSAYVRACFLCQIVVWIFLYLYSLSDSCVDLSVIVVSFTHLSPLRHKITAPYELSQRSLECCFVWNVGKFGTDKQECCSKNT